MIFLNFWLQNKKKTANIAKQRLQNILSTNKKTDIHSIYYLSSQFKHALIKIIREHSHNDIDIISIQLKKRKNNTKTSELKIILIENK